MRRALQFESALTLMSQPTDFRNGADILAAADPTGKWRVRDNAGNTELAKAVSATASGTLWVHLVDSYSDNERHADSKVWCDLAIVADAVPQGAIFDEIDVTRSTQGLFVAGVMKCWL